MAMGTSKWTRRAALPALLLACVFGLLWWFATVRVPQLFHQSLAAHAAHFGVVLRSDGWRVDWQRRILTTNNLTVEYEDGSRSYILLTSPYVALDFERLAMLQGFRRGIYQVYVHRPTVRVEPVAGAASAWQAALAERTAAPEVAPFRLGRLYADVVSVQWRHQEAPVEIDNGVLTVTGLTLPGGDAQARAAFSFHGRADGGKLSLEGEADPLRWSGRQFRPWLRAQLSLSGASPEVTARFGLLTGQASRPLSAL